MVTIRNEALADIGAREALLDRVWGPARFERPPSASAKDVRPPRVCRLLPTQRETSSALCGSGTSAPGREGRRCCSARSRSKPVAAATASAPP